MVAPCKSARVVWLPGPVGARVEQQSLARELSHASFDNITRTVASGNRSERSLSANRTCSLPIRDVVWRSQRVGGSCDRFAEKGLEGMELGLPWDYAGNIMFPTVCCFLLPLSSPHIWQARPCTCEVVVFEGVFMCRKV